MLIFAKFRLKIVAAVAQLEVKTRAIIKFRVDSGKLNYTKQKRNKRRGSIAACEAKAIEHFGVMRETNNNYKNN